MDKRKTGKSPRSLGFNQQHEGKTWRAVGCSCLSVHFLVSFFYRLKGVVMSGFLVWLSLGSENK